MMNTGMFYYAKKVSDYDNIINKETQCFVNLVELLRLLSGVNRNKYIFEDIDHVLLMRYIKHSLIESKIIYIDDIEIDNIGSVCERYVLDLSELDLEKAYLERYDLSMVNLSRTNLRYSTLDLANLRGANLQEADLEGAELGGADLRDAQLQFAHLVSANLPRANLIGAYLVRADLRKADLTDVNLTDAELEQSEWYLSDVKKIFPQLKSAKFTYIIVADCKKKKLYKNELFPDINSPSDSGSSLFLNSELRKSLEKDGIDLLDFCMIDDEIIEVLEEAGLDSDDFDFNE